MLWQDYHLPTSVGEALELLASYRGEARVVAGGTDLILEIQAGHRPPVKALVDVTRIAGANEIRREGDHESGYIVIGCGVTHTQIVGSALVQQYGTALAEGCGVIGGPQVRNVATLAGNIAHALPAGDGTISLLALGGEAQVARRRSQAPSRTAHSDANEFESEWMPLEKLCLGPGKSLVDQTREIITALRFIPTGQHEASAFARIMRPQGVALPILGMAARLKLEGDAIAAIRISVGPVAPTPFRACNTEAFLMGTLRAATDETIEAAIPVLLNECHPRTSAHRSTAEYRREMLSVLLRQVLSSAMSRARA